MVEKRLELRFADALEAVGLGVEPTSLLVACSGGLDSTVLLHLLRFGPTWGIHSISAAHFDHAMRETSAADAAWVAGLCRAWEIPLTSTRAATRIVGEEFARNERYRFFRACAQRSQATWIVTGHHADDQAETVLFRIVRGTGVAGLRGIPARGPDLLRPLLPFWREELKAYALERGLRWRDDPTNAQLGPARNRLRSVVLPELERTIAPGARRNLVALASLARENEDGLRLIVDRLLTEVVTEDRNDFIVDRSALAAAGPALGARVVRELLRRLGVVPDRAGTRSALQFITDAASGREIALRSGVRISTEFDRAVIRRDVPVSVEAPLSLDRVGPGSVARGSLSLGGQTYDVTLTAAESGAEKWKGEAGWAIHLPGNVLFPLLLRGRLPGDRVRLFAGSRSLKRLMIDRRVPRGRRETVPVVVDAAGSIIWVPGLFPAESSAPDAEGFLLEVVPVER